MTAYFTVVSSSATSSLTIFAADASEALRKLDELSDRKRHLATFDDTGAELTREDLLRLTDEQQQQSVPQQPDGP